MAIERYYNTKQLAEMLGLNPKTIANSRYTGDGIKIPFIKFGSGGVIRYKSSDVEEFIEANTFNHNGEAKIKEDV